MPNTKFVADAGGGPASESAGGAAAPAEAGLESPAERMRNRMATQGKKGGRRLIGRVSKRGAWGARHFGQGHVGILLDLRDPKDSGWERI